MRPHVGFLVGLQDELVLVPLLQLPPQLAGAVVSWVLLVIEARGTRGVLEVVDAKDKFKDSAMFSNFFAKAASSRSPRDLRSKPVESCDSGRMFRVVVVGKE